MLEEMQQDTAATPGATQSGDVPVVETSDQEVSAAAEVAVATAQPETKVEDRSWQSRYDRLQQEVGRDLLGYARSLGGGDKVVGFLKELEGMLGHSELGPIVQNFIATKQFSAPKPKNEWDEPDQEPEWKNPIKSVLAELQTVKSELTGFKQQKGADMIRDHTKKFLSEMPMSDPERALFSDYMDSQFGTLSANPQGAGLLSSMNYQTFKTLALPGVEEFRDKIEARRIAKTRGQLAQKATDAPAQASAGKETRPNGPLPSSTAQLKESVRRAFMEAMQQD